eukprot:COSAG03_NODE_1434_length_4080_cov_1013.388345_5_plen_151_part_00
MSEAVSGATFDSQNLLQCDFTATRDVAGAGGRLAKTTKWSSRAEPQKTHGVPVCALRSAASATPGSAGDWRARQSVAEALVEVRSKASEKKRAPWQREDPWATRYVVPGPWWLRLCNSSCRTRGDVHTTLPAGRRAPGDRWWVALPCFAA